MMKIKVRLFRCFLGLLLILDRWRRGMLREGRERKREGRERDREKGEGER